MRRSLSLALALVVLLAAAPAMAARLVILDVKDGAGRGSGSRNRNAVIRALEDHAELELVQAKAYESAAKRRKVRGDLGAPRNVAKIAPAANVDAVLVMTLKRNVGRITLTAQVLDRDGAELWSRPIPFDGQVIPPKLARKLARAVSVAVDPAGAGGGAAAGGRRGGGADADDDGGGDDADPPPGRDPGDDARADRGGDDSDRGRDDRGRDEGSDRDAGRDDRGRDDDRGREDRARDDERVVAEADPARDPDADRERERDGERERAGERERGRDERGTEGEVDFRLDQDRPTRFPLVDAQAGLTITWRSYTLTPIGNAQPVRYTTQTPYPGFALSLQGYPLHKSKSSFLQGLGATAEFSRGFLQSKYTEGAQEKTFGSADSHWAVDLVWRYVFASSPRSPIAGIRAGFDSHSFVVDPNAVITSSVRSAPRVGLDVLVPIAPPYVGARVGFVYLVSPDPGLEERAAYGADAKGTGFRVTGGIGNGLAAGKGIVYDVGVTVTSYSDNFSGPGTAAPGGGTAAESYTGFGATVGYSF